MWQKVNSSGDAASSVTLSSRIGRLMRLSVNPAAANPAPVFTAEHARHLQNELHLSARKTNSAVRCLKTAIGASSVQPNIRQSLKEADHQLNDLFVVKQLPFVREGRVKESAERWAVVCEDLEELQSVR